MRKTILAIPGSIRKNSVNHLILSFIATSFKDIADVKIFNGITSFPHFNPDVNDNETDLDVLRFREEIVSSDGVIVCTPEYVFSLPGSLKNALEWTVSTTAFLNKPTAVIVASGLGEKTLESLLLIMTTLGARISPQSALLIQGARAKVRSQHEMDDRTFAELRIVVNALIENINTPI